ncbi:MAG: outer membrane beta-barrel protein [Ginsengibacter sp.]
MGKGVLIFIIGCMLTYPIVAQNKYGGMVTDDKNFPLPFATILLSQNDQFLTATTTDEFGKFNLDFPLLKNQKYSLKLSLVGYITFVYPFIYPDTGFSKFILLKNKELLNEITVTANQPLVTRRADRYIINVENSILANGNLGLEVLRKSPGLWVNNNGGIRIKGNQSVTVMINDVVQRMSEDELAEYLKSLRSEDINQIEVIQNPPAEYEAAGPGGIIHIILKKSRKDGLNGSLYGLNRLQGDQFYISDGANLDYKVKKYYFTGAVSLSRDRNSSYANSNITYPDNSMYKTNGTRDNDNRRQQFRFGIGYDINKNQTIAIQSISIGNQFYNKFYTSSYYEDAKEQTTGKAFTDWVRKPLFISNTLNYSWKSDSLGSLFKIVADYMYGKKSELNQFTATYNDALQNITYRVSTPVETNIYSLQADYTKMLSGKLQVKAGAKYAKSKKDNELIREDFQSKEWKKDSLMSNRFLYNENIIMFYVAMEKTVGKTEMKAGLRAEETFSNGNSLTSSQQFKREYLGWFPSIFISHTLNEKKGNSVYLNYARRLKRPGFQELNPYRLQFDNHTIMLGNPYLTPQYTHNVEAGYHFLHDFSATIYLAITDRVIGQIAMPVMGNIIEYQYQNLDKNTEYGISLSAPFRISKGWTSSNSAFAYYAAYTINQVKLQQQTFALKSNHNINLKNLMDIEVIAEYRSKYVEANTVMGSQFYCDLGISRKILKGKGRLKLYCSDITNSSREKEITNYAGTHIYYYQKRQTRNLSISINYNFSAGKKFNAKKIETGNTDNRG